MGVHVKSYRMKFEQYLEWAGGRHFPLGMHAESCGLPSMCVSIDRTKGERFNLDGRSYRGTIQCEDGSHHDLAQTVRKLIGKTWYVPTWEQDEIDFPDLFPVPPSWERVE